MTHHKQRYLHAFVEDAARARLEHEGLGLVWGEEEELQWKLDDTVKLTFAGDVCSGLQYVAPSPSVNV